MVMPSDPPNLRFVWNRERKTPLENQLTEAVLHLFLTNKLLVQKAREGTVTSDDASAAVQETIAWANATFPGLHVTQNLSS